MTLPRRFSGQGQARGIEHQVEQLPCDMLQPITVWQRRRRGYRREHSALKALDNREEQGVLAGVASVDGCLATPARLATSSMLTPS